MSWYMMLYHTRRSASSPRLVWTCRPASGGRKLCGRSAYQESCWYGCHVYNMSLSLYIYIYIHIYMYVYIYIYIYYIHVYTHTSTYIDTRMLIIYIHTHAWYDLTCVLCYIIRFGCYRMASPQTTVLQPNAHEFRSDNLSTVIALVERSTVYMSTVTAPITYIRCLLNTHLKNFEKRHITS